MRRHVFSLLVCAVLVEPLLLAQTPSSERVQVSPPAARRAEPPSTSASVNELELRADTLKAQKAYLDALDYYRAALAKKPDSPSLHNKMGITEFEMDHFREASKHYQRAIKLDHQYSDAYNNLGVIYYIHKKYDKAIKEYQKAIEIRQDAASYYSNLGSAYFSKKEFEKASIAYNQALQLDPEVFERTSRGGVQLHMRSPEDRAHFDYVLAKLYAKMGSADRSLQCLRRALEGGYKGIDDVYKDDEFAELRKDPRFTQLMSARPPAIPQ